MGKLNCKGLAPEKKRKEKTSLISFGKKEKKLDIYCLQEEHIQNCEREQARWKSQGGFEFFF